MATNMDIIKSGGPHFAWDSTLPTWLGIMRRGGDGKRPALVQGPGYMATHTMGAWNEGEKVYLRHGRRRTPTSFRSSRSCMRSSIR